uniref:Uncharacterized protein AlNc14C221G9101 n=1 Tax=Albugo laibachii Nc14 TaxID=890382 RepID=F0WRV9_9STRA|nr:conserved hypothetical protein [Albugo laibachii Nc14]|eukprot:CCA24075.1 conserved hypothetical protein [Albugo laibachii Nc14]
MIPSDEESKSKKFKAAISPSALSLNINKEDVQKTIDSVNDLLHQEELSQKETWQIGKRLKKTIDENPDMERSQLMDALFLWGTALARLASQHGDVELANAAINKFEEIDRLSDNQASALGAVGYTLWATCLLVLAKEQQTIKVFDKAFWALDKAIELDDGNKFEISLHYAKALSTAGDFLSDLSQEHDLVIKKPCLDAESHYKRALKMCESMECLYQAQAQEETSLDGHSDDEDTITKEDYAQVELLRADIYASIHEIEITTFEKVYRQYKRAFDLDPRSDAILLEWMKFTSSVLKWCSRPPSDERIETIVQEIDGMIQSFLLLNGFDIKDYQHSLESDTMGVCVPHLLHALGELTVSSLAKQTHTSKSAGQPLFDRAHNYLSVAHHFDERLGCYGLARLYAIPKFGDDAKCLQWLETAESYGILEIKKLELDFGNLKSKVWFQSFLSSIKNEQIDSADKSAY